MKRSPLQLTPLGLSLLAALVLHLLGLSAWHLQRSRQRPPTRLTAADDTPLLLQFSRQAPEAVDLQAVPLPPATQLPPPPPETLARVAGQAQATTAAGAGRLRTSPTPRPSSSRSSGRSPARGELAGSRPGKAAAGRGNPPDLAVGSTARKALQQALQEAAASGGREPHGAAADQEQREPDPGAAASSSRRPEHERHDPAAERLWLLARPARLTQGRPSGLPADVELRRLPLEQARRSGARPVHLSRLRHGERLILLWIDGPTLWLLSAPIPGPAATAPAEGAASGEG